MVCHRRDRHAAQYKYALAEKLANQDAPDREQGRGKQQHQHQQAIKSVGIVLKIETQHAFSALPALLLAAMRHPRVAVMVARGDLGVEVGFGRLSEVQEEILRLCEAAQVPVIWATQVLESLAKQGLSSRAEVTDAAMASRAECVMLNKRPFILNAVTFLGGILQRMQANQSKKTATLRRLAITKAGPHDRDIASS